MKRSRKSVALELVGWLLVAIATAVLLQLFAEEILPTNF